MSLLDGNRGLSPDESHDDEVHRLDGGAIALWILLVLALLAFLGALALAILALFR